MPQMPEARQDLEPRVRHQRLHAARHGHRHRQITLAGHQTQLRSQARQITLQRRQIPARHHAQHAGHMPWALQQEAVLRHRRRAERGTGFGDQVFDHACARGAVCEHAGHQRQTCKHARQ
ncbi:MAG: hypothetical protein EBS48_08210, partial [Actinobacteria bacterium]|nr:hypothetical protein [Actinomycetota bacterium]